jgi:hypothetical protein
MPEMATTKTKRKRLKLSQFLAEHGVRYKWIGTWPAIPVSLGPLDSTPRQVPQIVGVQVWNGQDWKEQPIEVPPDTPPEWVGRIYERIFQQVLKFNRSMSIEFLDAVSPVASKPASRGRIKTSHSEVL